MYLVVKLTNKASFSEGLMVFCVDDPVTLKSYLKTGDFRAFKLDSLAEVTDIEIATTERFK